MQDAEIGGDDDIVAVRVEGDAGDGLVAEAVTQVSPRRLAGRWIVGDVEDVWASRRCAATE